MDTQIEKQQSLATTRLCEAAILGNVRLLLDLLEEDPLMLERCIIELSGTFRQSPFHVAVSKGHLEFVVELLHREPELAAETNDNSKTSSPFHIASAKGHLQILKALIQVKPNMCLARDKDGRTPIFVAAVNGQIDALEMLHRANSYAAQGRTLEGETILHLCVIHNQLKALERLLELDKDYGNQLINSKDNNGNNVFQLAVIGKHTEMIDFLARHPGLNKNALNQNKMTVKDIHIKQKNWKNCEDHDQKVEQYLKHAEARPAKEILKHQADSKWLEEQRASLMVVASLIATMAFQVGINPPGGVFQDTKIVKDKNGKPVFDSTNESSDEEFLKILNNDNFTHVVGTAVWSYRSLTGLISSEITAYDYIVISNTIGLISSLSVILLLISGFPCKRYFLMILRIALWIAVSTTTCTYYLAIWLLTYDEAIETSSSTIYSLISFAGLIVIILFGHFARFILKLIGWERRQSLRNFCKRCFPCSTNTIDDSNLSNDV